MQAQTEEQNQVAQFEWANSLLYGAVVFVVIGMVLTYGSDIQSDVRDGLVTGAAGCNATTTTGCGIAYNVSTRSLEVTEEFSKGTKKGVKIGIGVILIGAIMGIMYGFYRMRQG